MLTAHEALAIAHLITPQDFSIHKHIEIRIWDAIQNGGTQIVYAGEITTNVIDALRALGYTVTMLSYEGKERMIRVSWKDGEVR